MDIQDLIKQYCLQLTSDSKMSALTIKNYKADIYAFIRWYESDFKKPFNPRDATPQMLPLYQKAQTARGLSFLSIKRHISSIRHFFAFLHSSGFVSSSPFAKSAASPSQKEDKWHLRRFKSHLHEYNLSSLTIKNYISDIAQFLKWAEEVKKSENIYPHINNSLIEDYKKILYVSFNTAPTSINRKLSALRKYFTFLSTHLGIHVNIDTSGIPTALNPMLQIPTPVLPKPTPYSSFPPLRLAQKVSKAGNLVFDEIITIPLATLISKFQGSQVFVSNRPHLKSLYQPKSEWIKSQAGPTSSYLHFLILSLCMIAISMFGYYTYLTPFNTQVEQSVLSKSQTVSGRTLSFVGRIADEEDLPITSSKKVRFALYNNPAASGSAMLWQEVNSVLPNSDGVFSIQLGTNSLLPTTLFSDSDALWLGIAIENAEELSPRHQIATTQLATNAETLQGLTPITDLEAGTANAILALDSGGNLTIGGNASPIFQAVGGSFTLQGQSLILKTVPGSNGNVELSPDGTGLLDIQKPIFNSTNNNNLAEAAGSVEIDDTVAILATSSAVPALFINQNSTGSLISANSSGITKFSVDQSGSSYFAGNVGIGVKSPQQALEIVGGKMRIRQNASVTSTFNYDISVIGQTQAITSYPHIMVANKESSGTSLSKVSVSSGDSAVQGSLLADYTGVKSGNDFDSAGFDSAGLGILVHSNHPFMVKTNNLERFRISNLGNIGIGTSNPSFKLDILDSQSSSFSANIVNTNTGNDADILSLKLGTTSAPSTSNKFIDFLNGSGASVGSIAGNGSGGISYTTSGIDFAEYFPKKNVSETFKAGTIVCLEDGKAVKCDSSKNFHSLGVVSDRPGFVGGADRASDPGYVLVGLLGQLPVTISTEKGKIKAGDYLTSSSIPGVAAKANTNDFIIGQALEDFEGASGSIFTYIYPSTNTINQKDGLLKTLASSIITTLQAGIIQASAISTQSLLIAGISLEDYIESRLQSQDISIIAPIARVDRLYSDVLTPLSKDSKIAVSLHNSTFKIHSSSASESAIVASIDNTGNATFSGTLQAQNATVSGTLAADQAQFNSATVSGTLRAERIIADYIDIPEELKLALLAGGDASSSAEFGMLKSEFGSFSKGLIAFGGSSFADIAVSSSIFVGKPTGGLVLSDNSINVLGNNVEIQPLRQGGVSFLSGLLRIDTDGNLTVEGNTTIKGKLAVGIISPLSENDLVIQLPSKSQEVDTNTHLIVQNASGSAVLKVNQLGDIIASGSATISKLKFNVVPEALALSATESQASGSAGIATISAHQKELTILNNEITEKSLIYITPRADTDNLVLYLLRQIPGVSFTIGLQEEATKNIPFNWLIVN